MVKSSELRWRGTGDRAPFGINHYVIGFHTDFGEHAAHQGGLVFAVPVAMRENLWRGVRLVAAYSQLQCHIANLALREHRDARIFSNGLVAEGVGATTFFLISGDASRRPRASPACQTPMSSQL